MKTLSGYLLMCLFSSVVFTDVVEMLLIINTSTNSHRDEMRLLVKLILVLIVNANYVIQLNFLLGKYNFHQFSKSCIKLVCYLLLNL